MHARFLGTVLLILAAVFCLDRLFYGYLIFAPENHSGWDSFRWYNFEHHRRRLSESRESDPEARPYILIVGSSIAKYSIQTEALQHELRKTHPNARVEMLVHASMMATDVRYYAPYIHTLRPDLVVYPTNPGDLDLERYTSPWEMPGEYYDYAQEKYLNIRRPMQIYYPAAYAREEFDRLPFGEVLRLHMHQSLYGLRYKAEWWDPFNFNMDAGTDPGELKQYLYYQGARVYPTVWRDGSAGTCMAFPRSHLKGKNELPLQFPSKLIALPDFHLKVFHIPAPKIDDAAPPSRALLSCAVPPGARPLGTLKAPGSGWRQLRLPSDPAMGEDDFIFIRFSHIAPEDGGFLEVNDATEATAGKGPRLPGDFGLRKPRVNDYLIRRPDPYSLNDLRLLFMDDATYAADFRQRIHPDDWSAPHMFHVHQFNRLRLAKYYTHWYEFTDFKQARELRLANEALARGTRVLLINNPENPLTLVTYNNDGWYLGYIAFLRDLARNPNTRFADLRDRLPMQYFSDAHHLTLPAVHRMVPEYARVINEALK